MRIFNIKDIPKEAKIIIASESEIFQGVQFEDIKLKEQMRT